MQKAYKPARSPCLWHAPAVVAATCLLVSSQGPVLAAAATRTAYAVIVLPHMPPAITIVRYSSMADCLAALPRLQDLVASEWNKAAARHPEIISTEPVSGDGETGAAIESACRILPAG